MKLDHLADAVPSLHQVAKARAGLAVNQVLNHRQWLIVAYIIECKQGGEDRAECRERLQSASISRSGAKVWKPDWVGTSSGPSRRALINHVGTNFHRRTRNGQSQEPPP